MDGFGALGLAEVDVGFAAHFGAVAQDAGDDLHLQLLCKQQTRAGMTQHMTAAGRQIQGRSLQQISKSLFHLARCSRLPVGCGDHIVVQLREGCRLAHKSKCFQRVPVQRDDTC